MPKLNPNRNISRAAQEATETHAAYGGYMVRFTRHGKRHQLYFGDEVHGGKRKALAAARIARDELEAKLGATTPDYIKLSTRVTSRNSSKIVGVRWSNKTIRRNGHEYNYTFACASWTKDPATGERGTACFCVGKHSRSEAWDLAVEARAKGLRQYKKAVKALVASNC